MVITTFLDNLYLNTLSFEKMQENPNLTTEEALEEVQNEEDLNSARDWY
jgi:hypothetical protein